ncbi:MAG TPA: methyltransferase domain-containing protein, partial [Usitatibacter sp.]|nr:methyltransferase domain-containing protein [Usitatibacter sp.]
MSTPSFPKRDPADAAFWDLRYEADFTPWEAGIAPRDLRDFVMASPAPRSVLVPGCGSARDVRFLAAAGWEVLGLDFSPAAVAAARKVLGSHAGRARQA